MNKKPIIILLTLLLIACGRPYIVPAGASSEQIFQEACSSCHKAKDSPEIYFKIKTQNRNISTITNKINSGGFIMPAYPHITGRQLQKLSQYVLSHSVAK